MTQTETQLSIKWREGIDDKFAVLQRIFPFFIYLSKGTAARQSRTATLFQIKISCAPTSCGIFIWNFLSAVHPCPWRGRWKKEKNVFLCSVGRIKACISLRPNIRRSDCAWLLCLTSIACGETCWLPVWAIYVPMCCSSFFSFGIGSNGRYQYLYVILSFLFCLI